MASDLKAEFEAAAASVKTAAAPKKPISNEGWCSFNLLLNCVTRHTFQCRPHVDKLKVYALYKQATVGDVNTARPGGFLNFEVSTSSLPSSWTIGRALSRWRSQANAKWDAWNAVKGKSAEDAMRDYIAELARQKDVYN